MVLCRIKYNKINYLQYIKLSGNEFFTLSKYFQLQESDQPVQEKPELAFNASRGWVQKFMTRHSLSLRAKTSLAQMLPKNLEDRIAQFYRCVHEIRALDDLESSMIANMDETPAFFDIVPNRSVEQKGKKSVIIRSTGSEKRHITVVLAALASGDLQTVYNKRWAY